MLTPREVRFFLSTATLLALACSDKKATKPKFRFGITVAIRGRTFCPLSQKGNAFGFVAFASFGDYLIASWNGS